LSAFSRLTEVIVTWNFMLENFTESCWRSEKKKSVKIAQTTSSDKYKNCCAHLVRHNLNAFRI